MERKVGRGRRERVEGKDGEKGSANKVKEEL